MQSLCPLCLCGKYCRGFIHHRDTEDTEIAQREIEKQFLRLPRAVARFIEDHSSRGRLPTTSTFLKPLSSPPKIICRFALSRSHRFEFTG